MVIHGRVQGVGFRYSAHAKAKSLGLRGWVRNRHDGAVEAEFEGEETDLANMRIWCGTGPAFAKVVEVDEHWESGPPKYHDFKVRSSV